MIAVTLIITNILTLVLLFGKSPENRGRDYPLVDIARSYIQQEHFIVNIQPLREELIKLVESEGSDKISIYFEFLNTGANVQINNELRFYPASLVKLPSALVTMKKIERGEWNMDSRLVLFEEDKDPRYGDLYKQPVGTSFSMRELLEALLKNSDNTAHRMLMRNLSGDELQELKDAIGLDDLFDEKQEVSAKEYSRLFRALYNSSFLRRSGSQQILEWLSQTRFKDSLDAGVSNQIVFPHKIGDDDVEKNYLDSGIVYVPNRPYLITVMVKELDEAKAQQIMKKASEAAYKYVDSYGQNQ